MTFIQMLQLLRITLKIIMIYKKMINIIQLKNNGN